MIIKSLGEEASGLFAASPSSSYSVSTTSLSPHYNLRRPLLLPEWMGPPPQPLLALSVLPLVFVFGQRMGRKGDSL